MWGQLMHALWSRARALSRYLTGGNDACRELFPGSASYWEHRYEEGGTSGEGSYGRLAEFKAEVLNGLVRELGIESVIEFGCGDGNQLRLARYPSYVGLDVSGSAVVLCKKRFGCDGTKSFFLYDPFAFMDNRALFTADAAFSLDVIYHLVEDSVFETYMHHLFGAARRFVVVYSTDFDQERPNYHIRHRRFTAWQSQFHPEWTLARHIPNRYPPRAGDDQVTSAAEFFLFARTRPGPAAAWPTLEDRPAS
jgi:SAM-dependent methyltransferase